MNKKGISAGIFVLIIFLLSITAIGITAWFINDYETKLSEMGNENTKLNNSIIQLEKIKAQQEKEIFSLKERISMLEKNNKELLDAVWYFIRNPIIITIIEERTSHSSSSTKVVEDICLPCPNIPQCPAGKHLESSGTDECGCIKNPKCVVNNVLTK